MSNTRESATCLAPKLDSSKTPLLYVLDALTPEGRGKFQQLILKRLLPSMTKPLNKYSSRVTQPKSQGASQAMLYATGLVEADMNKPQVGIASVWFEGNPCNMHLLNLAAKAREGVGAAGMVGMRFNTVG